MVDTIQAGLGGVADSFIGPNQPEYAAIEPRIVRYGYEPRRATQLIEELGYTKSNDGYYRDGASQPLNVELRTIDGFDVNLKTLFPVADYWQRVGVGVDPVVIPRSRASDLRYRTTFPGFEMTRNPNYVERLQIFHSSQMRLPE